MTNAQHLITWLYIKYTYDISELMIDYIIQLQYNPCTNFSKKIVIDLIIFFSLSHELLGQL